MAGAFTHFCICYEAINRQSRELPVPLKRYLNHHVEFLLLGAASPDLPYLSIQGGVNWADLMHYENSNGIVIHGYEELQHEWSVVEQQNENEVRLAWLFGYISHLIADATIHPIVQAIVGDYEHHKPQHRECEMTQDSMIFLRQRDQEIQDAESIALIANCDKQPLFDETMEFWKRQAQRAYPAQPESANPSLWYATYTTAIDLAQGDIPDAFRHVGKEMGIIYRRSSEIPPDLLERYFRHVRLPASTKMCDFENFGFLYAVSNVRKVWCRLFEGLRNWDVVDVAKCIKNWNLDTGVDLATGEMTFWE